VSRTASDQPKDVRDNGMSSGPPSPERLVSQKEAATFLHVSQSYLRASACPKVLLPGNGPKDRPLVRYRLSEVAAWSEQWSHRATVPQRRAS
jgi:hypothetical protein